MSITRASDALKIFFWVAFAAFLGASIPHVAWFFSVFEPINGPDGWFYWIVSYGIAISIDVTVFLLSMTVAGLARQKKSKVLIISVWLFILTLAGLSWFINGKYAIHFEQSGVIAPSPVVIHLFILPDIHIADLNPIIASCFQALAVAYTWISDKIASGEQIKTAEELEQEANELERKIIQQARIDTAKRERRRSVVNGLIDEGKGLVKHAINKENKAEETPVMELSNVLQGEESRDIDDMYDTGERESFTNILQELSEVVSIQPSALFAEGLEGNLDRAITELEKTYPKIAAWRSIRGKSVTLKEISEVTGKHHRTVHSAVLKGSLTRINRYRDRVLLTSVIAWLLTELSEQSKVAHEETVEMIALEA